MPTTYITEPALARVYRIADCFITVQDYDEWLSPLIERLMDSYLFTRVELDDDGEEKLPFKIKFISHEPTVSDNLSPRRIALGHYCTDGQTYYLQIQGSVVILHPPAANSIDIWLNPSASPKESATLKPLLGHAVGTALRRLGLYDLHAAAVVEPNCGKAALLLGDSGSGKSTLTMRLAASRWRYISDDTVAITNRSRGVEVFGVRRAFYLTNSTVAAWQSRELESALDPPCGGDTDKRRLDPRILYPDGYIESCVPRALFFTSISGTDESRVVKISQQEALERFFSLGLHVNFDRYVQLPHMRALCRLIQQNKPYLLSAGKDVLHQPRFAAKLLGPYLCD